MAKMTCHGAIREGKKVVMTQTYGIEQRGGDSTAYVIISDEQIGSPIVENDANVVCALSQSTYELCYEGVAPGGLLFCNTSIVKEPKDSGRFSCPCRTWPWKSAASAPPTWSCSVP